MQQGWSTYTGTMSRVPSTELLAYHVNQGTMSRVPSTELLATTQIPNSLHLAQSGSNVMVNLPERPDQPECHYFMKTGNCKYGTTCKYHHPKERNSDAMSTLGPLGLPIRPGQAVCTFYSTYGTCKYGSACKFDHPMVGYYNYSLPSLSTTDRSAYFPNQRSSEVMWTPAEASTSRTRAPVRIMKSEMSNGLCDKEKGDPAQDAAAAPVSPPEHSE